MQNSYTYGAWGELRAQNETVPNSYGYTGREFAEEGLYFYRARYLDPGVGRFLSEDPIGMIVDMNHFRYAINNPTNYFDPYGLQLEMPVKKPNKNCCDKEKIKDEIEGTQKIITAMDMEIRLAASQKA